MFFLSSGTNSGVLRVDRLPLNATPGDIRRHFKHHGARPEDIHLVLESDGKHNGSAFLTFTNQGDAAHGLNANDSLLKDKRLAVNESNPAEFNKYFPGVPMFSYVRGSERRRVGSARGRGSFSRGRDETSGFNSTAPFGEGSIRERSRESMGKLSTEGRFTSPSRRDSRESTRRGRSRSPLRTDQSTRDLFLKNFGHSNEPRRDQPADRRQSEGRNAERRKNTYDNFDKINERKFVYIAELPYNATEVDIQHFFRPVLTRDIFFIRNKMGKYIGKPNGNAVVEFFSEGDAREVLKCDGKRFGQRNAVVQRARREEIISAIEQNQMPLNRPLQPPGNLVPDLSNLGATNTNPQVQALLTLLTATVNSLAGSAFPMVPPPDVPDLGRSFRGGQSERRRRRSDPVIGRVASSANIDVNDIKMGRAVGIRNLPYEVTPDEILQFFRNFPVIADSVRIHYLEDGRCSGDAIISFRGSRDARDAVQALNRKNLGRRKVELFFL